jgi:hypothetical protein
MNPYKLILGGFTAFLVLTLIACPAMAQTSTAWTVEAFVNNVPTGPRREATTPTAARTAAQSLCGEFPGEMAAQCLALLKSRSLASLTASGPNWAHYFLDLELNAVGGRQSYVVITAQKAP